MNRNNLYVLLLIHTIKAGIPLAVLSATVLTDMKVLMTIAALLLGLGCVNLKVGLNTLCRVVIAIIYVYAIILSYGINLILTAVLVILAIKAIFNAFGWCYMYWNALDQD